MARIDAAPPSLRRARTPLAVAAIILVIAVAALAVFLLLGKPGGGPNTAGPNDITIEYATEGGTGAKEGIVNSPLRVSVRIPWSDGSQENAIGSVMVQIVDEAGNPAEFGGSVPDPFLMKPTFDIAVWDYATSIPSKPGTYHARVQVQKLSSTEAVQTLDLREPAIQAKPEAGPPVTSGYAFVSDSNLWVLSTDTTRQRRLTYFPPVYEYADTPAWSPDGKQIAFTYSPPTAPNETPATEIWAIAPGQSGPVQLVAHAPGESLYEPSWSPDGKYLYFTAESLEVNATMFDASGIPVNTRRIDRVELQTGVRSEWMPLAQMPGTGTAGNRLAFLEYVPPAADDPAATAKQRLVSTNLDGSDKKTLVDENAFQLMYAPGISPDGKWVTFAAINVPPTPIQSNNFDFFKWLFFQPDVAYAHGLPWDVYAVSTAGGTPARLTTLDEDQPYPTWLDNSTVAFMGITGLYKVSLKPDGHPAGDPTKVHPGAPHGGLTWHAP
ncbi:MAG TPA: hypothetical protein VGE45_17140 [Chloroflexia bacterium]